MNTSIEEKAEPRRNLLLLYLIEHLLGGFLMLRVITRGSIFDSSCDYLTNTINTVGAMGAGLALEFRLRVPEMYQLYKEKCTNGKIKIGEYWVYDRPNRTGKIILNFPVKKGFNHPSKWEYIIEGLRYFVQNYRKDNITSIAMPTLGSRLGKLDDEGVLIMMQEDLQNLPITIEIYRKYEQDRLTKCVKRLISEMTVSEISREFGLSTSKSEQIKARVSEVFLLSDLVIFHKMSIRLVQMLYDLGFDKSTRLKMTSFTGMQ
jgi:O-acetyl-ADP-ribose deacetylase (regulator of RNase III)